MLYCCLMGHTHEAHSKLHDTHPPSPSAPLFKPAPASSPHTKPKTGTMNPSSSSVALQLQPLQLANGEREHTVITIAATNSVRTTSLEQRIAETKWLLSPSAGNESCCIFRVPQYLHDTNKKSYRPRIVSIGPYHHGEEHLKIMEQHKWRFLHDLLTRTPTGPTLDDYLLEVTSIEEAIRDCYSETLEFSSPELVEMMMLDGLFIIEVFCKIEGLSPLINNEDPIFKLAWVITELIQDLLLLENQIPFLVLQTLFDKSRSSRRDSNSTLAQLALKIFGYGVPIIPYGDAQGRHLLDLLRLGFIPREMRLPSELRVDSDARFCIQSATKLHLAGVKFKSREAKSFLEIKFFDGVLEIPEVRLGDHSTDLFLNFIAFEQCYYHSPRHITTYAAFMSSLIRTPKDVEFLCDNSIMENYSDYEEIANFFRNVGKGVAFDFKQCYLLNLFKDVSEYQKNICNVRWAEFKFKYFASPWSFLSALAAVILLIFTAIQTFFAFCAYLCPPESCKLAKH